MVLLKLYFPSNWFRLAWHKLKSRTWINSTAFPCGWRPEENDVWRLNLPRGFLSVKLQLLCEQIHRFSEIRGCVPLWETEKKSRVLSCYRFLPNSGKRGLTIGLHQDFCQTPWMNVLVIVQRPPSHPSFLTANSSGHFSRTARLGFIFFFLPPSASSYPSILLALSNAERGTARPRRSVPALVQLQSKERRRGMWKLQRNLHKETSSVSEIRGTHVGGGFSWNNSWSPSSTSFAVHAQKEQQRFFNVTSVQRFSAWSSGAEASAGGVVTWS